MRSRSNNSLRLLVALAIAAFSLFSFFASREYNPVTGENQFVALTPRQEIALGVQAAPEMIQQFGGLERNQAAQDVIDDVGFFLVENSVASETAWQFEFGVLADEQVINAFALPGGQIFITDALFTELDREALLAGVLAHEIAHVLARHSSEQIASSELSRGLLQAFVVASEGEGAGTAALVAQLINLNYSREAELEADAIGVRIMSEAGYDPRALIEVMEILAAAGGGARQPEFFSTHPNPDNRIQRIEAVIREQFPNGVPDNLQG